MSYDTTFPHQKVISNINYRYPYYICGFKLSVNAICKIKIRYICKFLNLLEI